MREELMPSHVIILGCGRSGTSIFGELFEHIPGYKYYSEPSFDLVVDLSFARPVAIKVPKESDCYPPPPGLSFPLDTMLSIMPERKQFYWQVRHPLDAIASLRPGISNDWGHHPRPPDWRDWLQHPLIERCAHHWAYINSVGYESVKALVKICRFEEMLNDPKEFAHQICSEIGVNPARCIQELASWSERVQNTNNKKFIEARASRSLSRADHKYRIGRWKENLGQEDLRQVIPIVRETAEIYGYEVSN